MVPRPLPPQLVRLALSCLILACVVERCSIYSHGVAAFPAVGFAPPITSLLLLHGKFNKRTSKLVDIICMKKEQSKATGSERTGQRFQFATSLSENPLMKRAQQITASKVKNATTSEDSGKELLRKKSKVGKPSQAEEVEEYRRKVKELSFNFSDPLMKEINDYLDSLEVQIDKFIKERDEFESLRSEAKFDVKDKEALKFIRKVEKILVECGGKAVQTRLGKVWKQNYPDEPMKDFLKSKFPRCPSISRVLEYYPSRFHVENRERTTFFWLKKVWLKQKTARKINPEPTVLDIELQHLKELEKIATSDQPVYASQLVFNREMREIHRMIDDLEDSLMRAEFYKYQGKGSIPDFLKANLTIPEDPSSEDDT